jgi:OmpA-OmpF porin, OOP family
MKRAFAAVLSLLVPTVASAQTPEPGFALNRFQPAERGSDWFGVDALDLRGHGRFALGVVGDYAHKPLVIYDTAGNEVSAVVSDQLALHVGGAVVLFDRLRLGVSLPLFVVNEGTPGELRGRTYRLDEGFAVGDLRLSADVRLFGSYDSPFTIALGAAVHAPTGDRAAFTSDGKARIVPRLAAAGQIGPFVYGAHAGVDVRLLEDDFGEQPFGNELVFGAAAGVKFLDGAILLGPELLGRTVLGEDVAFKKRATPLELIFGAHFRIADAWQIGVGGGPGFERALGSPQYRLLAVLGYRSPGAAPPPRDRDGDGIFDIVDACPDQRGIPSPEPTIHGCPDGDGDGIVDVRDACPTEPGVAHPDPAKNGCPAPKDSDGDGIIDAADACPQVPGSASPDPKKNGCPDRDRDGIVDPLDACPDEPGVADPDPGKNGCPADRDRDGIPDAQDACPDQPGDRDPNPAKNGCPKVVVEAKEIKILERIEFDTGRDTIKPESEPVLEAVRRALADNPDIRKIVVEGHTDSRGNDSYNLRLSRARAIAVVTWLVTRGIDKARLEPQGFGETRPIDSNGSVEGRQRNRRVQFMIRERTPQPAP